MKTPINRRLFLRSAAYLAAASPALALFKPMYAEAEDNPSPIPAAIEPPKVKAPRKPPALAPDQVRETVGQSHRSLEAVMKLVEETPLLANACWDWGGGDFETPLQAAAHTGRREIAEYLLRRNARLDLYAAGMLGELDFVRATLALNPKAHEIPGPHGYTLLHCAIQGGIRAKPVHDWLLAQGVPNVAFRPLPFV